MRLGEVAMAPRPGEGTSGDVEYLHADLTRRIIGAAVEVHRTLGPGLLESCYEHCLSLELEECGLACRSQLALPITYKGKLVDCSFRLDMIVNELVILEIKSVEAIVPIHEAQLLTYMKLSGLRVGLLLNFNVEVLKEGIRRRIL